MKHTNARVTSSLPSSLDLVGCVGHAERARSDDMLQNIFVFRVLLAELFLLIVRQLKLPKTRLFSKNVFNCLTIPF